MPTLQRICVDYNEYDHADPDAGGAPTVLVGPEGIWPLIGVPLTEGAEALFVAPGDLEMRGVLQARTIRGGRWWFGVVDPRTQRDFVRADLHEERPVVPVLEPDHLTGNLHDGEVGVLSDAGAGREVYGVLMAMRRLAETGEPAETAGIAEDSETATPAVEQGEGAPGGAYWLEQEGQPEATAGGGAPTAAGEASVAAEASDVSRQGDAAPRSTGGVWFARPDWATVRTRTDLTPEAWARHAELLREQEAQHRNGPSTDQSSSTRETRERTSSEAL